MASRPVLTAQVPPSRAPDGAAMETLPIVVAPLAVNEVDEAMDVLALAFGATATAGTRPAMRAAPHAWLLARCAGRAAGVVTSNGYGRAAYVAMLAVDPEQRRRGVATRLMQALLARLEATGTGTVLLDATAQAESLYRALGFVEIDRTRVFARTAPAPAGSERPDAPRGALARALDLDARTYGCDRSPLLRLYAASPYAFVASEDDGYAIARGPVLGPFAAERTATAERLLRRVLAARPHVERAFPPLANRDAAAMLEAQGFSCARTLAHMARGAPSPFRRERIFSQASLGHG